MLKTRSESRNKHPTRLGSRQQGFTLVELLVVIAIISIIAGFLIPTLLRSRSEADKIDCQNKLKELAKLAMLYADSGKRFFPFGKGSNPQAHESLNELVAFNESKIKPEIFICRTWRGVAAAKEDDGKYLLTEETCAYTWPGVRLTPTDEVQLSSDKYIKSETQLNGHEGGMNVVSTDSSVTFVFSADIPGDGEDKLPKGLVR
jgi:prepilin-type N-terminal cleavage/methylation domain-containing protein